MPEPEAVLWGRAMDMPGDAAPDPAADDVMPSHRWLAEPDPSPSPAPEPWAEPSPEPGGEPGARPEGEGAGVSYLYPVPFPQGVCVDVHTIALGVIFSLLFVAFLLLSPVLVRKNKWMTIGLLLVTSCRALFFLVDPYHTRGTLSSCVIMYLYGLPFPMINLLLVVVTDTVSAAIKATSKATPFQKKVASHRILFLGVCALEFVVQFFADTARLCQMEYALQPTPAKCLPRPRGAPIPMTSDSACRCIAVLTLVERSRAQL